MSDKERNALKKSLGFLNDPWGGNARSYATPINDISESRWKTILLKVSKYLPDKDQLAEETGDGANGGGAGTSLDVRAAINVHNDD